MSNLLNATSLRSLLGKLTGDAAQTILGQTNASPAVVNVAAHGFAVNDVLAQYGDTGNTACNGLFQVASVVDANHYTLNDLHSGAAVNGNGASAGSPKVQRVAVGWQPGDCGDVLDTCDRVAFTRGTDGNRTSEPTIRSIFGL